MCGLYSYEITESFAVFVVFVSFSANTQRNTEIFGKTRVNDVAMHENTQEQSITLYFDALCV